MSVIAILKETENKKPFILLNEMTKYIIIYRIHNILY